MRPYFLLSPKWKIPSLILLLASSVLFVASVPYEFVFPWLHHPVHTSGINLSNDNLTDELALSVVIISLLMLAFCAERVEDEYVRIIRLKCWQWAVMVNYGLLMVGIWLVYGMAFIGLLYYNTLTTLLLFLVLFYGRLYLLPVFSKKPAL
jgi:hypothetical protein